MTVWGQRVFPAAYDWSLWWAERRGMRQLRRQLLSDARGRVLEIGAGTGLNVALYPSAAADVVFSEPFPEMAGALRRRVADARPNARVVQADAETLPFDEDAFDTVVSTLVLCTVPDPRRALREIHRVLAPGGRLIFLEHVRAPSGSALARWQDRIHPAWRALAYGCRCNQDTLALIGELPFVLSHVRRERWLGMPALVRPLVLGRATPVS